LTMLRSPHSFPAVVFLSWTVMQPTAFVIGEGYEYYGSGERDVTLRAVTSGAGRSVGPSL
jgi:hypothetical protein